MEDLFSKLSLRDEKDKDSSEKAKSSGAEAAAASSQSSSGQIKILSWNVMGDEKDDPLQPARMDRVVRVINQKQTDIVFLQSLHKESSDFFIKEHARKYSTVQQLDDSERDNYRLVMLRKSSVTRQSSEVIVMPDCLYKHDALKVKVEVKGIPMALIAVHIRSRKEFNKVRLAQHDKMFTSMNEDPKVTFIAGGTTNSRDYEFQKAGCQLPPRGIFDVWQAAGSPSSEENTWDMSVNTNRPVSDGRRLNAFRFERLFIKHPAEGAKFKVTGFCLVGTEELACGKFPSDHFGILATLKQVD